MNLFFRRHVAASCCWSFRFALVVAVLLRGIHKGEFSENVNQTIHASTGLYIDSLLHDLPLRHPVQYTYRYYAQYPALGIVMYPPAFYVIEGVSFFILGPSVVTARLAVLFCALLGLFFWFRLVNELEDEYTAALSTRAVSFSASCSQVRKDLMLESPWLLSFCIAASYFWIAYLRRGSNRLLYGFATFLCLAFLTKHHAIYLFLWFLITLIALKKWDRVLNWRVGQAAVCLAVVAPVNLVQIVMNPSVGLNVAGASTNRTMWWDFTGQTPRTRGLGSCRPECCRHIDVLVAGQAGECHRDAGLDFFLLCGLQPHPPQRSPLHFVLGSSLCLFRSRPFHAKNLAAVAADSGHRSRRGGLGVYTLSAWSYQRPYVSGYEQMAQKFAGREGGCVLRDMDLPGNFYLLHARLRSCPALRDSSQGAL